MSPVAEPPTPTPSRKPRGKTPRRKEHSKSIQENGGDIVLTPKSKRRTSNPKNHNQAQHQDMALDDDLVSPLTPHRASEPAQGPAESSISPMSSKRKPSRGRKKTSSKQEGNNPTTSTAISQPSYPSMEQPQPNITPLRQAPQMYAGPTFHASPAPSSLPIPKFFAKNTTQGEKLQDTSSAHSDGSSEQESSTCGDESPTLRSALRIDGSQAREPSPLDIFFKADRAEKARFSQSGPLASSARDVDRAKSASPSTASFRQMQPRQHNRSQTETSPPIDSSNRDDIKAKTEALKQLLLAPKAQHSSPALSSHQNIASPNFPYSKNVKPSSGSPTPSRLFQRSADPTRSESSLLDSPDIPSSAGRAPQFRQPLNDDVRQELLSKLSIDRNDTSSKSRYVTPVVQ